DAVIISQLRMNVRRPIRPARAAVDRLDLAGERDIEPLPFTHRAFIPGVVAALGNVKQPAHCPYRKGGLVHSHEPEERFGVALLSFANQAAAFDKISRSSFSCRFSRRSRVSSSRSLVVRPPSPRLASRSACLTHFRIVQSVGPNSLDRSPYLRPAQTNSTICLRNSAGYFVPLFAIADSFSVDTEVSTKAGQAHKVSRPWNSCSASFALKCVSRRTAVNQSRSSCSITSEILTCGNSRWLLSAAMICVFTSLLMPFEYRVGSPPSRTDSRSSRFSSKKGNVAVALSKTMRKLLEFTRASLASGNKERITDAMNSKAFWYLFIGCRAISEHASTILWL